MDLKTEKRQPAFHPEKELKNWGLTLRDFTQLSSLEARRDGKTGSAGAFRCPGRPLLQFQASVG